MFVPDNDRIIICSIASRSTHACIKKSESRTEGSQGNHGYTILALVRITCCSNQQQFGWGTNLPGIHALFQLEEAGSGCIYPLASPQLYLYRQPLPRRRFHYGVDFKPRVVLVVAYLSVVGSRIYPQVSYNQRLEEQAKVLKITSELAGIGS